MKLDIADIIALIIVVGAIVLLCLGINSEVKSILAVAAGWTFGGQYVHYRVDKRPR